METETESEVHYSLDRKHVALIAVHVTSETTAEGALELFQQLCLFGLCVGSVCFLLKKSFYTTRPGLFGGMRRN